MTTTPLPPFPRPSVFDPGRFGVAYSQTQMVEFATQARADLEAEIERKDALLLDALSALGHLGGWSTATHRVAEAVTKELSR